MFEGNVSSPTTLSTTASTAVASCVAAVITYPAESRRLKMTEEILRYWNPEEEIAHVNRNLRIFTPLVRLSFNEMARGFVSSGISTSTSSSEVAKLFFPSDIERQVQAGFIAGVSQALLFTPFEFWRANNTMHKEQEYSGKWKNKLYSQVLGGGSIDPQERRARVVQALTVGAGREVIFNVTFFPVFHVLRQHFRTSSSGYIGKEDVLGLTASGIIAGSMCSALCTPMDIWIAHMMNSRERWNLWSGKKISAVPLNILSRGLILQAFFFGPAFGAVAAVYELT